MIKPFSSTNKKKESCYKVGPNLVQLAKVVLVQIGLVMFMKSKSVKYEIKAIKQDINCLLNLIFQGKFLDHVNV